jgi:hypothetical protein
MQNKIFFIFVIIFIQVSSILAQIRVGFIGGINSTGFGGDDPPNGSYSSDFGYNVGITADFYFLHDVALNIQPMYSYESTNIQYDVDYQYDKYDSISVNVEYFELPLNIKVVASNKIAYLTAGLSFKFPLSAISTDNTLNTESDIKNRFESLILDANFGVGMQFELRKSILFFELRYSQSLTNLTNLDLGETTNTIKLKSNSIQIYSGLLITL